MLYGPWPETYGNFSGYHKRMCENHGRCTAVLASMRVNTIALRAYCSSWLAQPMTKA